MDNKVTQRQLLQRRKNYIVSAVARISSEQVRVRRVREQLSQVYALIYPGVAPLNGVATAGGALAVGMNYSGDDRHRTSEWGCHLSGDAILWKWRQFNDKKRSTPVSRDLHRRRR